MNDVEFTRASSDEDSFDIRRIQSIQNIAKDKKCIRLNIERNKVKVKAVLDTGSPISIIPMHLTRQIQPEKFREIQEKANYTDFNSKEVKLAGEFAVSTKYEGKESQTKWKALEGTKEPIVGMDSITALSIHIITGGETIGIRRLTDNTDDLCENLTNHPVHDLEVRIQLKPDHKPPQQKAGESQNTSEKQLQKN